MLRWGLLSAWAKDPNMGFRMINARSETVAGKRVGQQRRARRSALHRTRRQRRRNCMMEQVLAVKEGDSELVVRFLKHKK